MAYAMMRTCPSCSEAVIPFSKLFFAALGRIRFRCPNCMTTVKLKTGFGEKFVLPFVNEAFFLIAVFVGLAFKSWLVFFALLVFPIAAHCTVSARLGQILVHERGDG